MPDLGRKYLVGAGGRYHSPCGNTLWYIESGGRHVERTIGGTENLPDVFYSTTEESVSSKAPSPEPSSPGKDMDPHAVHERSFLDLRFKCALDGCHVDCDDNQPDTIFCNGCGPCSPIRYCRLTHLLADACIRHHKICGTLYFDMPVDLKTLPIRYRLSGQLPMIQSLPKLNCYELQRQRAWSMYRHDESDYAIFSDFRDAQRLGKVILARSQIPSHKVFWKVDDPMKDIFNRCLNLAFLDARILPPIILLYRILRATLMKARLWPRLEYELQSQIYQEFAVDMYFAAPTTKFNLRREWAGKGGVQEVCEKYEAKYPVLRLWRREHPELPGPRYALERYQNTGDGFPGCEPLPHRALWGPAWDGWRPFFTEDLDAAEKAVRDAAAAAADKEFAAATDAIAAATAAASTDWEDDVPWGGEEAVVVCGVGQGDDDAWEERDGDDGWGDSVAGGDSVAEEGERLPYRPISRLEGELTL